MENVCFQWVLMKEEIMYGLGSEAEKLCGYSRDITT